MINLCYFFITIVYSITPDLNYDLRRLWKPNLGSLFYFPGILAWIYHDFTDMLALIYHDFIDMLVLIYHDYTDMLARIYHDFRASMSVKS
jgi:hypothetical protein